jgi:ethanolamine ammonia-lyase small subunit
MNKKHPGIVNINPWQELRRLTPARIALGRVGNSMPTDEVLRFGVAHAAARDAVHIALDIDTLERDLAKNNEIVLRAHSKAPDRATYLLRPDYGRRLAPACAAALAATQPQACDLVFVVADGLSALAVQRHAAPLLREVRALLPAQWNTGPVVIAAQARVAIGDEIGELLRARTVVVMIGERPGLSSPDSLGIYMTHAPKVGFTDSGRNCISNIRPEGLQYAAAAQKLVWLLHEARRLNASGVTLKDQSGDAPLLPSALP